MTRCEGMTRHGGMMTLGRPRWLQCENDATVMINFEQTKGGFGHDVTEGNLPVCHDCWKKAINEDGVEVIEVIPIEEYEAYVEEGRGYMNDHAREEHWREQRAR